MRTFPAACWLVIALAAACSARDIYLAQNSAGRGDGADCANAFAYGFFNDAGNWGSGGAQIGPGTVVHLCGIVTTFNGSSYDYLTFRGSGVNGPTEIFSLNILQYIANRPCAHHLNHRRIFQHTGQS